MIEKLTFKNSYEGIADKIDEIIEDNEKFKDFVISEFKLIREALTEYGINSQGKDEKK